jgi:RNA polymerase sigma factor (sigma-70 family)
MAARFTWCGMAPRVDPEIIARLVLGCQNGDQEAFERLFSFYRGPVYAYLVRTTGDRHLAEDLLQDVFLRLIQNVERYTESGRFEAWLFRIAANRVRDWARRKVHSERVGAVGQTDDESRGPSVVDRPVEAPPEVRLVRREQTRLLEAAMTTLESDERQVLMLRHYGDLSFREIADIMDSPLGTVLAKSHRALLKLREKLHRPLMQTDDG